METPKKISEITEIIVHSRPVTNEVGAEGRACSLFAKDQHGQWMAMNPIISGDANNKIALLRDDAVGTLTDAAKNFLGGEVAMIVVDGQLTMPRRDGKPHDSMRTVAVGFGRNKRRDATPVPTDSQLERMVRITPMQPYQVKAELANTVDGKSRITHGVRDPMRMGIVMAQIPGDERADIVARVK